MHPGEYNTLGDGEEPQAVLTANLYAILAVMHSKNMSTFSA